MIYSLRTGVGLLGNNKYFEEFLQANREYGDVFDEVWFPTSYACPTFEKCEKITQDIIEAMELFKEYGIIPSIQVSRTIGHAPVKNDMGGIESLNISRMLSLNGELHTSRLCWNDENFRSYIRKAMRIYAKCKPVIAWVDDDLRIRRPRGQGTSLCFCDTCLAKFNKKYGYSLTFEDMQEVFTNNKKIRKEYIKFQTETLGEFAEVIARAFREVSPDTIMALQSGADITLATDANKACLEAMERVSGKAPCYRGGGGFYDDHTPELIINKALKVNYGVSRLPESVKIIASEIENLPFIAYGKTNDTPCIEAALFIAYGCNMASITLMNANEPLSYHKKMLKKLAQYKPYLKKVVAHNSDSKVGGVVLYQSERAAERTGEDGKEIWDNSVIYDAKKLTRMGIPFHCGEKGCAYLLVSSAVDALVEEDIEELLRRPVITDASAIEKLIARGYGDKLNLIVKPMPKEFVNGVNGRMTEHKVNENLTPTSYGPSYFYCKDKFYILEGNNIEVVTENYSYAHLGGEKIGPETAIVTTEYGAKWVVKARNLTSGCMNFAMRNQLVNMINYISDEKLPSYLATEEQVMVIPRIKDGKTVSVTLFNVSLGDYEDLELIVNNPANEKECTMVYPFEEDKKLPLEKYGDSFKVKIDSLERWRIKTILL